ncbi:MAG: hypothetical protein HZA50_05105 [Planctomycetes bacterium]|nr:hypothetical protein [Planctomycetota bacterium]
MRRERDIAVFRQTFQNLKPPEFPWFQANPNWIDGTVLKNGRLPRLQLFRHGRQMMGYCSSPPTRLNLIVEPFVCDYSMNGFSRSRASNREKGEKMDDGKKLFVDGKPLKIQVQVSRRQRQSK